MRGAEFEVNVAFAFSGDHRGLYPKMEDDKSYPIADLALADIVEWLGFEFNTDEYLQVLDTEADQIFQRAQY